MVSRVVRIEGNDRMGFSSHVEAPVPKLSGGGAGLTPFKKMQAAGNDFIVLDGRHRLPFGLEEFAQAACDRHFGIGADGIVVLRPSANAEFAMVYHNADGSRTICLNGMRCLARYIYTAGLLPAGTKRFELETDRGQTRIEVLGRGDRIQVELWEPSFEGTQIPTSVSGEHLEVPLTALGRSVTIAAAGMGNPHCVLIVDDVDRAPVATLGPALERHAVFPERTNVEFVEVVSPVRVRMRVWERGVGETLACGTGVCAVVAVLARQGRTGRRVVVECRGGEFDVHWNEGTNRIMLTGPAEEVFSGELNASECIRLWQERQQRGWTHGA